MNKKEPSVKRGRGRPEGSISKLSRMNIDIASASGELPHEFLLRVMRGEIIVRKVKDRTTGKIVDKEEDYGFDVRVDAAKAAAPYYAPKISTVEVIHGVPDGELDNIIAQLAAQAGVDLGPNGAGTAPEDQGGKRRRVKLEE